MSHSRRQFLTQTSLALLGAAAGCRSKPQKTLELPPGAPPAVGTAPVGPEVSASTFAEAEKLVRVELTSAEREMAARSWRTSMASLYERRTGPRKVGLEPALAPWSRSEAVLPGEKGWSGARPISAEQERSRPTTHKRRGHCLRATDKALALDRTAKVELRASHRVISAAPGEVRS